MRPSWMTDRFTRLSADAGQASIRLHDLRHAAATLMLAAGVDMKVVQETPGRSALAVTADLYTSVLPELAQAAEATAAIVPRRAKRRNTRGTPKALLEGSRRWEVTPPPDQNAAR